MLWKPKEKQLIFGAAGEFLEGRAAGLAILLSIPWYLLISFPPFTLPLTGWMPRGLSWITLFMSRCDL